GAGKEQGPTGNAVLPAGPGGFSDAPTPGRTLRGRGHQRRATRSAPRLMANPIAAVSLRSPRRFVNAAENAADLELTAGRRRHRIGVKAMGFALKRHRARLGG